MKDMIERMTPKERWLAAIHMKLVDRLPFWPKLDGAYPKVSFRHRCVSWVGQAPGPDKGSRSAGLGLSLRYL